MDTLQKFYNACFQKEDQDDFNLPEALFPEVIDNFSKEELENLENAFVEIIEGLEENYDDNSEETKESLAFHRTALKKITTKRKDKK
ncbi:MAG: hypothetical protein ACK5N8_03440 [Alphaproteobacteria bacterium]